MPRLVDFLPFAALVPLPLLVMGAVYGTGWSILAIIYLTVLAFLLDETLPRYFGLESGRWARQIPVILALAHLVLLPLAVIRLGGDNDLTTTDKALIFIAFGLFFGTVSMANAHELIHRPDRMRRTLGTMVFTSLLFGHHVSAHLGVHHRFVATPHDPNSARLNEGFYRFFARAWRGSFRAGLKVETARHGLTWHHPYGVYISGALATLGLAFWIAGPTGALACLGLAAFAQMQLLLSDYVQHYGLSRAQTTPGKYVPVTPAHSWNSPHRFTAALMLNAPRHSDHHAHPSTPYHALRLLEDQGALLLPHSLPAMSVLALSPTLWRRVMNPRVAAIRRENSTPGAV